MEFLLALLLRIEWQKIRGFFRFLAANIFRFYFIFYLVILNWWDALLQLGNYALILVSMSLVTFIFVQSTPPREIMLSFRWIRLPSKIAITLMVVICFIPLLTESIRIILLSQKARGYRLRFWQLGPVIVPAIFHIMELSIQISLSLEAHGYSI